MKDIYYFQDINIGYKCTSVGKTITEADIVNFVGISGDYNLLHTDAEFCKNTLYGERIVQGLLVMSIASGLFTRTEFGLKISKSLIALVGIKEWSFKLPVKINDTIYVEVEIIDKIDIKPDSGRIIIRRTVFNQRNEVVQVGDTVMLIKKELPLNEVK